MIAAHTRGGGRVRIDETVSDSGHVVESVAGRIRELTVRAAAEDFDLATLLTTLSTFPARCPRFPRQRRHRRPSSPSLRRQLVRMRLYVASIESLTWSVLYACLDCSL